MTAFSLSKDYGMGRHACAHFSDKETELREIHSWLAAKPALSSRWETWEGCRGSGLHHSGGTTTPFRHGELGTWGSSCLSNLPNLFPSRAIPKGESGKAQSCPGLMLHHPCCINRASWKANFRGAMNRLDGQGG